MRDNDHKLDTLVASNNRVGRAGGAALVSSHLQGDVQVLTMQGCSFVEVEDVVGKSLKVDEANPDGMYRIRLSRPRERAVAIRLLQLLKVQSLGNH